MLEFHVDAATDFVTPALIALVEDWAERLKPPLTDLDTATFYEVPVIGGMARIGKWFIDSGMRRGTPTALHENVITVWGTVKEWKARAGVTDDRDRLAYLTLIDRDGRKP